MGPFQFGFHKGYRNRLKVPQGNYRHDTETTQQSHDDMKEKPLQHQRNRVVVVVVAVACSSYCGSCRGRPSLSRRYPSPCSSSSRRRSPSDCNGSAFLLRFPSLWIRHCWVRVCSVRNHVRKISLTSGNEYILTLKMFKAPCQASKVMFVGQKDLPDVSCLSDPQNQSSTTESFWWSSTKLPFL